MGKGILVKVVCSYRSPICRGFLDEPAKNVDDINAVNWDRQKFEVLRVVKDSSKSTDTKISMKRLPCDGSLCPDKGDGRLVTFIMDRGCDDNKIFLKQDSLR